MKINRMFYLSEETYSIFKGEVKQKKNTIFCPIYNLAFLY